MPRKTDTNQKEIVQVLRDMGAFVFSLHGVGKGCPDLLVIYRGQVHLAEIKNASGRGRRMTDAQEKFHKLSGAKIAILMNTDDAIAWIKSLHRERIEALLKKAEKLC